jgi:uncharacterized protein YozE (UPF0346 family)
MGDLSDPNLRDSILKTIQIYNKYRSPEVTANFVELSKYLVIEFQGPFCQSCGVQDYFEDFIYDFREVVKGLNVEIDRIESVGPQSFRVYYILDVNIEHDEKNLFKEFLNQKGISLSDYLKSNACTKDVILFHFRTWKSQLK